MNRENDILRTMDLKLRLFVEYTKIIISLYEEAVELSKKLNEGNLYTGSVIDISNKKKQLLIRNDNLIELISDEGQLWNEYYNMERYLKEIASKLAILNDEELDLLYLRYERQLTLRQIGDLKFYSYMQVQRNLDSILEKIYF